VWGCSVAWPRETFFEVTAKQLSLMVWVPKSKVNLACDKKTIEPRFESGQPHSYSQCVWGW